MLAIMNSKLCVCVTVNCYSQWKRSKAKRSNDTINFKEKGGTTFVEYTVPSSQTF